MPSPPPGLSIYVRRQRPRRHRKHQRAIPTSIQSMLPAIHHAAAPIGQRLVHRRCFHGWNIARRRHDGPLNAQRRDDYELPPRCRQPSSEERRCAKFHHRVPTAEPFQGASATPSQFNCTTMVAKVPGASEATARYQPVKLRPLCAHQVKILLMETSLRHGAERFELLGAFRARVFEHAHGAAGSDVKSTWQEGYHDMPHGRGSQSPPLPFMVTPTPEEPDAAQKRLHIL